MGDHDSMARVNGSLPMKMRALQYSAPEQFAVVELDVPALGDDDVLVKIEACGVCGTDLHLHKGEFLAKYPLTPGHEAAGAIVAVGKNVKSVMIGDRVVADPLQPCLTCFYCLRGKTLLCENLTACGGNVPGGVAEYCKYPAKQVHHIGDLPALHAVLVEPAACATHGIERMAPHIGSRVLLFGCGPTGILLAQLLRLNGVAHLTIASKGGPKLDLAKSLDIADEFICISDTEPHIQMEALRSANPHGFDIVVEATGAVTVLEQSVEYVRKGGTLVVYGVYDESVKVSWSPSRIWAYEITVLASFCCMNRFPDILEYVRGGKLKLDGIASKGYKLEEWGECLEAMRRQEVVKAAIVFD